MKFMKILLVSLVATACGTKAFADSDCGDPSKGKFTCDTDQISLEYTEKEINNNGWYNRAASGNDAFIFGPYLDINPGVGKFKEKSVQASVPIEADGGQSNYPCTASSVKSGELFYTVQLTATSIYGREVVLDSKNVYKTWNGFRGVGSNYGGLPQTCHLGITFEGDPSPTYSAPYETMFGTKHINLSAARVPGNYRNFQIKIKNVSNSIDKSDNYFRPLKTHDNQYFFNIEKNKAIFLNIVGFR